MHHFYNRMDFFATSFLCLILMTLEKSYCRSQSIVMNTYDIRTSGTVTPPTNTHYALLCGVECNRHVGCHGYVMTPEEKSPCVLLYEGTQGVAITNRKIYYVTKDPQEIYPISCAGWKQKEGEVEEDRLYTIDPDGPGGLTPFNVNCLNSTNSPTSVTHDKVDNPVFIENGLEPAYSNIIDIVYSQSDAQLQALAAHSDSCEMNIHVRCRAILVAGRAAWYGVNGTRYDLGEQLCPVPVISADKPCTCDNNDHVWREDIGQISLLAEFPIKKLAFGDLSHGGEAVNVTIGPMVCEGMQECTVPNDIPFTIRTITGRDIGDTTTYTCFYGMTFANSTTTMTIACTHLGTWTSLPYNTCDLQL